MTEDHISDAVRRVLRDHVETYEQLELLLLFGRHRDAAWTPEAVAAQIGIDVATAAGTLVQLTLFGLLDRSTGASGDVFSARPEHWGVLDDLARTYEVDRLGLMRLMTANALERVRTSALRAFSSAFLLRRKRDG